MTETGSSAKNKIVVGVDGSEGSKVALRWAMSQAKLTDSDVLVVAAWQDPAMSGYSYGYVVPVSEGPTPDVLAQKALDETIAEVSGGLTDPVHVATLVTRGYPAPTLAKVSKDAHLLVVGSRGHGAFAGMLLGSVSQHCVAHSSCPVVVVPTPEPATA